MCDCARECELSSNFARFGSRIGKRGRGQRETSDEENDDQEPEETSESEMQGDLRTWKRGRLSLLLDGQASTWAAAILGRKRGMLTWVGGAQRWEGGAEEYGDGNFGLR
ncbi:hypothetical protein CPB84DRAFT_1373938 [Gymnopilus junonius]|uniref:Uncharacterized protein n=1 Tax=Gymnopilus junonius TaxID=109634 RepID=A0A9P5NLV0_GYMJU|nr:hypothetical protein CPB84DRAFT_1373938 [Gymnopilus junonius]